MDFYEVLAATLMILQRQGRTSYRALKRQFNLDDAYLEDLKLEIIKARQLAVDQDGEILVWTGAPTPAEPQVHSEKAAGRFHALRQAVIALLQRERRLTYRELEHLFGLDDALLAELREALLFKQVARDEAGKGLVWTGEVASPLCPSTPPPLVPAASTSTQVAAAPAEVLLPGGTLNDAPAVTSAPARTGPEAERRHLTVMFCDLADSTRLAGQLDPEDLREVIRAYQQSSAKVIQQFEGHIAQYLGDGLLVYFGWPQAHEDDAQRALRAGLGIVDRITTGLNPRLSHDKGVQLTVRIGIHTGPVVVGEMGGAGRQENLATGETVNIASRLEGLAAPNNVVISPTTERLVRGAFVLESLGSRSLKGVAEPLQAWRVMQVRDVDQDLDEAGNSSFKTLLGRDEEIGILLRRWQQSKEGLGQVVLISGDAGIGKSSLVGGLQAHVRQEGAMRMAFRCSQYNQQSMLYPVITHLERAFDFGRDDSPAARLHKIERLLQSYSRPLPDVVPLLAALLSVPLPEGRYPALALSPQQQRQQTLDALVAWLLEEAERQPVLALWEDLHWADPSTLELLGLFIDQTPTAAMLHVLTFRPEFTHAWPQRQHMTPLTLNRLERPQVEGLVALLTGGKPLPQEVVEHIVGKTDGVPLYVEELTKMLLDSDLLQEEADAFVMTGPLLTVAIPDTLQDSLMARLDQLNTAKEVAQLGAVLGRDFDYDMLQAISPQDDATLQAGLARLVDAELFYQRGRLPRARYIFKHALIQDAAYASLLRSRRQRIHATVARVLTQQFPDVAQTQPELLAHHYAQAGQVEAALDHWQAAAERAIQRSACVEAIHSLDQALAQLALLPPGTARDRRELVLQVMKLGPLSPVKGYAAPECDETSARALTLCRQVGDNEAVFPALYFRWAMQYVRGVQADVFELSREYLERARDVDDDAALMVGLRTHAVAFLMRGDVDIASAHARQALQLYVPERHMPLLARFGQDLKGSSINYLAVSLALAGQIDEALALGEEAITHARSLDHINTSAYALWHIGVWLQAILRQTEPLQRYGSELLDLCREHRLGFWEAMAQPYLLSGAEAEQAVADYRRDFYALLVVPELLCRIGETYLAAGHVAAAQRVLTEAGNLMAQHGEVYWEPELFRLRGQLALVDPKAVDNEAEALFQHAIDIANQKGLRLLGLRAASSLARLWLQQGKRQGAHALLAPLYDGFTQGVDTADLREARMLLDELDA